MWAESEIKIISFFSSKKIEFGNLNWKGPFPSEPPISYIFIFGVSLNEEKFENNSK